MTIYVGEARLVPTGADGLGGAGLSPGEARLVSTPRVHPRLQRSSAVAESSSLELVAWLCRSQGAFDGRAVGVLRHAAEPRDEPDLEICHLLSDIGYPLILQLSHLVFHPFQFVL